MTDFPWRCFDCFEEYAPAAPRFAVLKKMRDVPPECPPEDRQWMESLGHDPVFVCSDCAGWYGDHAIVLGEEFI